jgi:DNA-binding LytR/AlgR family response regulator
VSPLRALIVDDEAPARAELAYVLGRVESAATSDEAETADAALELLAQRPYDVVFLDVRMPKMSGLDALPLIRRRQEHADVVFVTAYDEHALRAFDLAATDYLLKPVSEARLQRTLARLAAVRHGGARTVDRLPVESETATLFVRYADIRFLHARGHATFARTFDAEHRSRFTLAELERRLAPHGFIRVHRGFLVNPEHVVSMEPFFGGTYVLHVDDQGHSEVPVSRGEAARVRAAFGL